MRGEACGGARCAARRRCIWCMGPQSSVFRVAAAVVVLRGSAVWQDGRSASSSHGAQNGSAHSAAEAEAGVAAAGAVRLWRRTARRLVTQLRSGRAVRGAVLLQARGEAHAPLEASKDKHG